jgi:enoyl-[acyl-carrier protein] reductase I
VASDARAAIEAAIPHRAPFLFVDRVIERSADRIVTEWDVRADLPAFAGHYPDFALLPGVLSAEFAFQSAAILLSPAARDPLSENRVPVLTKIEDARFKHLVRPGETLRAELDDVEVLANARLSRARTVSAGTERAARALRGRAGRRPAGEPEVRVMDWLGSPARPCSSAAWRTRRASPGTSASGLRTRRDVLWCVHTERRARARASSTGDALVSCATSRASARSSASRRARARGTPLDGLVHSIAFADYSGGRSPFHATTKADFLRAGRRLGLFAGAALGRLAGALHATAAVVALSISTTRMAAENYGFLAPAKAALDSSVVFLAKKLRGARRALQFPGGRAAQDSSSRPASRATSESYLFAEAASLRKRALEDARGGRRGAVPAQPALVGHQRPGRGRSTRAWA